MGRLGVSSAKLGHIVLAEVLAPQGHVLLATSRPAGLDLGGRFGAFRHLSLSPLSDPQQAQALEQRLGAASAFPVTKAHLVRLA